MDLDKIKNLVFGLIFSGIIAGCYILLGKLSYLISFDNILSSPVWFPLGFGIGLVAKRKSVYIPLGLFLGSFFEALINLIPNSNNNFYIILLAAFLIGFSNLIIFLLGAHLIRNKIDTIGIIGNPLNSLKYLTIAIFLSLLAAILGAASLTLCGFLQWISFGENILSWTIGDVSAILIYSTPILIWNLNNIKKINKKKIELGLFIFSSLLLQYIIFLKPQPKFYLFSMRILIVPILIWAVFRFPAEISLINMVSFALTSIIGTNLGFSPFTQYNLTESLIQIQLFIIIISITNIFLVAIITKQQNTQTKLLNYSNKQQEEIKNLSGLLPICAKCKKIRDDEKNEWQVLEHYIKEHSDAHFTHGLCPDCFEEYSNEIDNIEM